MDGIRTWSLCWCVALLVACGSDAEPTGASSLGAGTHVGAEDTDASGSASPLTDVGGRGPTGGSDTCVGCTAPGRDAGAAPPPPADGGPIGSAWDPGRPSWLDGGSACACDDQNPCTRDECAADGCRHHPIEASHCRPNIQWDQPLRAAFVEHRGSVRVAGAVHSVAAPVRSLLLGTVEVATDGEGRFETDAPSRFGVNVLRLRADDAAGNVRRAVRTYLDAAAFYGPAGSTRDEVPAGIKLLLGPEVLDDDDIGDVDDLATLAHRVIAGIDVASLIGSPLTSGGDEPGFGWCSWEIAVGDVTFEVDEVDLVAAEGALELAASFSDVRVAFEAIAPGFACPDAIGTATSANASVAAQVRASLDAGGAIVAELVDGTVSVALEPPVIDVTGGFAALFDWAINFFSAPLARSMEGAIGQALQTQLAPVLAQALRSLSRYEVGFTLPALPGATGAITLTIRARPSHLRVTDAGVEADLEVAVSTPGIGLQVAPGAGAPARGDCAGGPLVSYRLRTTAPAAVALHDDVINQVLYSAWWGGGAHLALAPDQVAALLPAASATELDVLVEPALPPVLSSCVTPSELQIGAVRLAASFELDGEPAGLEAWASASMGVHAFLDPGGAGGLSLGLGLEGLRSFDVHPVAVTGALSEAAPLIEALAREVLVDLVVDALVERSFLRSFPIPALDIGGLVPGVPAGTSLAVSPEHVERGGAYVIVSGRLIEAP